MDFGEWELLHINEWWEVRMERKEGKTSFSVFTHSLNSTTLTPMNKITLPHGLRHIFHTTQDSFTSCPTELQMYTQSNSNSFHLLNLRTIHVPMTKQSAEFCIPTVSLYPPN